MVCLEKKQALTVYAYHGSQISAPLPPGDIPLVMLGVEPSESLQK